MKPSHKNRHKYTWRSGDYNIICDYSGQKIKRSDAMKTWDNYIVRRDLWEPRQPQDFVRGMRDKISVYDARSESEDIFLTSNEVTQDDL
jgi:hypothetical protein